MKKVGSKLRRELLSYLEVRSVYELANIDEMSKELQKKMKDGKVMLSKLKQYKFSPKTKEEMKADFDFLFASSEEVKNDNKKDNQDSNLPKEESNDKGKVVEKKEDVKVENEQVIEEQNELRSTDLFKEEPTDKVEVVEEKEEVKEETKPIIDKETDKDELPQDQKKNVYDIFGPKQ